MALFDPNRDLNDPFSGVEPGQPAANAALPTDTSQYPAPPGYRRNPSTGQLEPIPGYFPPGTDFNPPGGAQGQIQLPPGTNLLSLNQPYGTQPPPSTTPTNNGGGSPGGGQTLPPGSIGSLLAPYTGTPPSYVTPNDALGSLPTAPGFPTLPAWQDPTAEQAANYPGYKFAFDQGNQALMNNAAARGVTNTGGSLQDAINYGQNAATQNYSNVRNQMLEDYQTNLGSQYLLPYQAAYNTWTTQVPASQTAAQNQNTFDWNNYLQNYNIYRNQKLDTNNMLFNQATLGANLQ